MDSVKTNLEVLPQAIDVEEIVLGALILERDVINVCVANIANENVFYKPEHKTIYRACVTLYESAQPIDLISVTSTLRNSGELAFVGGVVYISQLTNSIGSSANIEFYVKVLQECYIKREIVLICKRTASKMVEKGTDVFDILEEIELQLQELKVSGTQDGADKTIAYFEQFYQNLLATKNGKPNTSLLGLGFDSFVKERGMFRRGNMVIIAGRPGQGKCLSLNTLVRMYDRTVKKVQDIVVGDKLMGDDGTPRNVLSLARGREQMYWIRQEEAEDYRVNSSHILSLKHKLDKKVVNIDVLDYIYQPQFWKNDYQGYKFVEDSTAIGYHYELTGIKVEKDIVDDYYGFEIDGNKLFCLGDYTVTHNTTFMVSDMVNSARRGERCVFFTLEMTAEEIITSIVCNSFFIDNVDMLFGRVTDKVLIDILEIKELIRKGLIVIEQESKATWTLVYNKIRTHNKRKKIDKVYVDYLQLCRSNNRRLDRTAEIEDVSMNFKQIAKLEDVLLILGAQLNREVEKRPDKKPIISDLKQSGSIEQDADVVIMLYRPEYYIKEGGSDSTHNFTEYMYNGDMISTTDKVFLLIEKWRGGSTGQHLLNTKMKYSYFGDKGQLELEGFDSDGIDSGMLNGYIAGDFSPVF